MQMAHAHDDISSASLDKFSAYLWNVDVLTSLITNLTRGPLSAILSFRNFTAASTFLTHSYSEVHVDSLVETRRLCGSMG